MDGLLGLLHGIWRIRPEQEGSKYVGLVSFLVDHARKVVQPHNSKDEEALGPWQEVHKKAYERLIFSIVGRCIVPVRSEFEESHKLLLQFLSDGPIATFSAGEHLEAVARYLSSLVADNGDGDWTRLSAADYKALCSTMQRLIPLVVHAACVWGLASLFLPAGRKMHVWITPFEAMQQMSKFLKKQGFDPASCLHPYKYRGLKIPHHISASEVKEYGLYRTGLVVLMLEEFLGDQRGATS